MSRRLIVNADDFGLTEGVNRAIVHCHVHGVVTSASLMVDRPAARHAAELSRAHPGLSVGLHWDAAGRVDGEIDTDDDAAVRDDLERQVDRFIELTGKSPSHLDSHWHVHREERVFPLFREVAETLGVPVRGDGRVRMIGGFYAQWEWKVTRLEYISVGFLERLIREEATGPWTELSCHPGYVDEDLDSVYSSEREAEVATLTDPQIAGTIRAMGLQLASYTDYAVKPP